jgi:hypothetical protein
MTGTWLNKASVDACGLVLDCWTLHLTSTTVGPSGVGPSGESCRDGTYQIDGQFGGFSLADVVSLSNSTPCNSAIGTLSGTINSQPQPLAAP